MVLTRTFECLGELGERASMHHDVWVELKWQKSGKR